MAVSAFRSTAGRVLLLAIVGATVAFAIAVGVVVMVDGGVDGAGSTSSQEGRAPEQLAASLERDPSDPERVLPFDDVASSEELDAVRVDAVAALEKKLNAQAIEGKGVGATVEAGSLDRQLAAARAELGDVFAESVVAASTEKLVDAMRDAANAPRYRSYASYEVAVKEWQGVLVDGEAAAVLFLMQGKAHYADGESRTQPLRQVLLEMSNEDDGVWRIVHESVYLCVDAEAC